MRRDDPRLKPCGTTAAYRRHLRHREAPCEACVRANREVRAVGRTLATLVSHGQVSVEREPWGRRTRNLYTLTDAGRR